MKLRMTLFLLVAALALMAPVGTGHTNAAGTRQRPFSEWLSVQGGAVVNPPLCASTVVAWLPRDMTTLARADYSGKIGDCITNAGGPDFHPEFYGTVTERDLPDGTAEIHVIHHFKNTYVVARDNEAPGSPSPAILGYNPSELIADPSLSSAVASGTIQVKFIIAAPGDPLPGLFQAETLSVSVRFQGSGPLREQFGVEEGTPGKVVVSQTGLFSLPGQGNGVADGFPAELVHVFQVGK